MSFGIAFVIDVEAIEEFKCLAQMLIPFDIEASHQERVHVVTSQPKESIKVIGSRLIEKLWPDTIDCAIFDLGSCREVHTLRKVQSQLWAKGIAKSSICVYISHEIERLCSFSHVFTYHLCFELSFYFSYRILACCKTNGFYSSGFIPANKIHAILYAPASLFFIDWVIMVHLSAKIHSSTWFHVDFIPKLSLVDFFT